VDADIKLKASKLTLLSYLCFCDGLFFIHLQWKTLLEY